MATYESLTQEEKAQLAHVERWARGALSSLVAYADVSDFNLKQAYYQDQVQPLLDSLDAGEVIPNSSGLGGAVDVTKEQLNAVLTWLFGIQADIDANISVVVKMIGVNAE